jgi:rare lipoprotein A
MATFARAALIAALAASPASAQTGIASINGAGPAACGGRVHPSELTAAHRTLPCGATVRVTNLRNGRSVVVRINDRGPAAWTHRIIDLTPAAARALGFSGLAPVEVESAR